MNDEMEKYLGQAEDLVAQAMEILTAYGLDVIGAILVLIVGMWFAGRAYNLTLKASQKSAKVDPMLGGFFASMVKYAVLAFVCIAVLNQFGVETTSLVAMLGAAGLAIGLALQGTLSNVAAGVMLLLFRPFKVGDFIEAAGHAGTVKSMNLFVCIMATGDNVQIIVPNSAVWGGSIVNFSANDTRRVDFTLGVSYDTDLDKAAESIRKVIAAESRVMGDPEPMVVVSNLGDSSVDFTVRVWVVAGDYWGVKFAMTEAFKKGFDADGIDIPFPTRTVYNIAQS